MGKIKIVSFVLMFVLMSSFLYVSPSNAVNASQILGDYYLGSFTISYPVYGVTVTQQNASYFNGKVSATTKGFAMEMEANFPSYSTYHTRWGCGFYMISGTQMTVRVIGEPTDYITVSYDSGILITSGSDYDDFGDYFLYTYVWVKSVPYYTLDDADYLIDIAVSEKDQTIAALNATIASMYTLEEVNQAVDDAVASKDLIITQKNQTISDLNQTILDKDAFIVSLIEFNSDGKLDLKDVIMGLQVLSGIRSE